MKHPFEIGCDCQRCAKERARRDRQSQRDALNAGNRRFYEQVPRFAARRRTSTRRPLWGSQEWAETRGDDLGESIDR